MAGKHISILVHFVWSTAGREPWIGDDWRDQLHSYIGGIARNKNAKLISAGGVYDHIHLYVSLPSTITVANFVNVVKSNSSRWCTKHSQPEKPLLGRKVTELSALASQKRRKLLAT